MMREKNRIVIRVLTMISFSFLISSAVHSQENVDSQDTTAYYSFHINYWFNMHHLLWIEAYMNTKADSSIMDKTLSPGVLKEVEVAVSYYRENLADKDLRRSDYMSLFKEWVTGQDFSLDNIPDKFAGQMEVLLAFNTTYEKHFWPKHEKACRDILLEHIDLIRSTEEQFVTQITKLTRQFWQFDPEKVRVDLSYYGKSTTRSFSILPYTSNFPAHIVMNVAGREEIPFGWLELLYHESTHHLILDNSYFVSGTIKDLAEAENLELPRDLSHAFLFYFTGSIVQKLFAEKGISYPSIYVQRGTIYPGYFPLLEKHLIPYINREITLTSAARGFIKDYDLIKVNR